MKINLTPQRSDYTQSYSVQDNVLTVVVNDVTDIFDFSVLNSSDEIYDIVSTLPVNPVLSAKNVDGTVEVQMIAFYGSNPTEEELTNREVDL